MKQNTRAGGLGGSFNMFHYAVQSKVWQLAEFFLHLAARKESAALLPFLLR